MTAEHEWIGFGSLPGTGGLFRSLAEREAPAAGRFPLLPWRSQDVGRALRPGSGRASAALWGRLAADGRRLGLKERGFRLLEDLGAGRGVVVATGQQPGLLGGPLYTLYKVASAVDLAEWIHREHGVPCAPLLWNAGDDADFAEISAAIVPARSFEPLHLSLDRTLRVEGGWVGALPLAGLDSIWPRLAGIVEDGPSARWTRQWLESARGRARDLGDLFSALYLELFGERGLLVVDARWPEVRASARDLFLRYVDRADEVSEAVRAAGESLAADGHRASLGESAVRFGLFAVEGDRRVEVPRSERRADVASRLESRPETVAPNVVLRPLVQDFLFPVAAVVLGPGEVGYWAQLKETYEMMGVPMPVVWPRLSATLVPEAALAALGSGGPRDALLHLDERIRDGQWRALPAPVREGLENLGRTVTEGLEDLRGPLKDVDRGLDDLVDSARRKMDAQLRRVGEQALRKLGRRSGPVAHLGRIRTLLLPDGRLQERALSSLWPFLDRGPGFAEEVAALAALSREHLHAGPGEHLAVRFENLE